MLFAFGLCMAGAFSRDSVDAGGYVPPASPPPEYQALYDELSTNLTAFESQIDAGWDGSVGEGRMAGGLSTANGNKSAALLTASSWNAIMQQLDAFEAMGVELVKIDTHYPVFTPAFHSYLAANPPPAIPSYTITIANFIGTPSSFYNKLAAEIEARGLDLWIEHSTLFGDFSPTPPAGYFADMRTAGLSAARARYTSERAAEVVLIAEELQPDYYTLVDEPTTQNENFGLFPGSVPIFDENGWRDFTQYAAQQINAAAPGSPTLLGAGSGTWESFGYTQRFAALPELDYVDFHVYPQQTQFEDFLQNVLDWADYVHAVAPEKLLTLGESWLYKESAAELEAGVNHNIIFGRDVYSFWEPLDRQHLEMLFKLTHYKEFEATMPFWSTYYFAYLTYGDPELDGLSSLELMGLAGQESLVNMANGILTGAGEKFEELLAAALDADGDGTPDSGDLSDADADGVTDQAEFYCGSAASLPGRVPERTDGVFSGVSDDGDAQVDEALPAGADAYDCDGDGYPGTAEAYVFASTNVKDQDACGTDAWAADLTSSFMPGGVNIADLSSFIVPVRHLNTNVGDNPGNVRWDLAPGASGLPKDINIVDLTDLVIVAPPMLGGVRAYNGPACPWSP